MESIKPLAMIVEDDEDLSVIYAEAVKAAGFAAECVLNGQQALNRLKEVVPSLVLLDMQLPLVDGADILAYIRATEHLKDIHVVIATSNPETTLGLVREQADLIFVKPVRFDQIRHLAARFRTP